MVIFVVTSFEELTFVALTVIPLSQMKLWCVCGETSILKSIQASNCYIKRFPLITQMAD